MSSSFITLRPGFFHKTHRPISDTFRRETSYLKMNKSVSEANGVDSDKTDRSREICSGTHKY